MNFFNFITKILLYTFIFIGICNSSFAKTNNFNYDAKNISNYFSGLVSFDNFEYEDSREFLKKIQGLENTNKNYSSKYIQSLVNLEKYREAYLYSKRLDTRNMGNFESNLILGLFEFKKKNFEKAEKYFSQLDLNYENQLIFDILKKSTLIWAEIGKSNANSANTIEKIPSEYENFKTIQTIFFNCHFDKPQTFELFQNAINDDKSDFSRYNFFLANYLLNQNNIYEAKKYINLSVKKYPNNLLINQFKLTIDNATASKNMFNCKNQNHILAEIIYVIANALSSTSNYKLSNFYTNLSKYLNPDFSSFNSLLAQNFLVLKKYEKSKSVYKKLSNIGDIYRWYSSRQIADILRVQKKTKESINFLENVYNDISPNVYQSFSYANFLKDNKKYTQSIELYSEILSKITKSHSLYPKILDRRGTAYERSDNWTLAEKDLLLSLKISPNEPYVMNYLAYTWIERGENTKKALRMLKQANNLKKGDGYITDSLGWAFFKLNNFQESKKYLQLAVTLMPNDPVVNDHFADCLWKNNKKIQARYYWKYVLSLEDVETELKEKIQNKLLLGLDKT